MTRVNQIVSGATKFPAMPNRVFILFTLLFVSLCKPAFAVWIGVRNDMNTPIRLVSAAMTSTTTGKSYPLFLGSVDARSETHWYHLQDSTFWEISVFAVIQDERLIRYGLRRKDDSHQLLTANLNGDVFLFTFAKDGQVDMSQLSELPEGKLSIKHPIWNVLLTDIFTVPAQSGIKVNRSIADEVVILKLLAGGVDNIEIPQLKPNSSMSRYCYMEGYRNGWYSSLFPAFDRKTVDLYVFFINLVADDKSLKSDERIWSNLNAGFDAGRQNALDLLKKHGF